MNMSRAWPTAPIADVEGAQPSTREIRPRRPTAGLASPQPVRCASSNGVPCMSWDGDFDIGIPAIDRDHRQLLDLFARVQAPGWSTESRELVRATVDDLAHHVTHHFRREEMLMHLLGYPGTNGTTDHTLRSQPVCVSSSRCYAVIRGQSPTAAFAISSQVRSYRTS